MAVSRPSIPASTLQALSPVLGTKPVAYLRGLVTAMVTGPARLPGRDLLSDLVSTLTQGDSEVATPLAANDLRPSLDGLLEQTRALQDEGDFSLGNDTAFPDLVQWCQGYLDGIQLDEEWLADKHALLFVLPISAIAQAEELGAPSNAKLEQCIERLPFVVPSLYRYWAEKRGPPAQYQ